MAEATGLIDAIGLRPEVGSLDWARSWEGECGAKRHVTYDPAADRPIGACPRAGLRPGPWVAITSARAAPPDAPQALDRPLEIQP
ncbi:MAG TPA: hypothetical protein VGP52_05415 [Stellaceae bacterium]|jgi:hypothetical protein|nr:hypothetical protein [Stellaceae bacterium]